MMNQSLTVLIVEDDEDDYVIVRDMLQSIDGIRSDVTWVSSPEHVIGVLNDKGFDVCFVDFRMGAINGVELLQMLDAQSLHMPVIMLTGDSDRSTDVSAMAAGASGYLIKGLFDANGLERAIRYAIDRKESEREMRQQVDELTTAHIRLDQQRRELIESNGKLEALAAEDALTGLWNRRGLDERLIEEFVRSRRYSQGMSLLVIDIDDFKSYNDAFGHAAGDDVIRAVAHILASTSRETDFTARYGGEEFVVILPHTNSEGAILLAERMRETVSDHAWPHRSITVSVGVSTLKAATESSNQLFDTADTALYEAKRLGRNQVRHADNTLPNVERLFNSHE